MSYHTDYYHGNNCLNMIQSTDGGQQKGDMMNPWSQNHQSTTPQMGYNSMRSRGGPVAHNKLTPNSYITPDSTNYNRYYSYPNEEYYGDYNAYPDRYSMYHHQHVSNERYGSQQTVYTGNDGCTETCPAAPTASNSVFTNNTYNGYHQQNYDFKWSHRPAYYPTYKSETCSNPPPSNYELRAAYEADQVNYQINDRSNNDSHLQMAPVPLPLSSEINEGGPRKHCLVDRMNSVISGDGYAPSTKTLNRLIGGYIAEGSMPTSEALLGISIGGESFSDEATSPKRFKMAASASLSGGSGVDSIEPPPSQAKQQHKQLLQAGGLISSAASLLQNHPDFDSNIQQSQHQQSLVSEDAGFVTSHNENSGSSFSGGQADGGGTYSSSGSSRSVSGSSGGGSGGDCKRRKRFLKTAEALRKAGLMEVTIRTAKLMQQSRTLQESIDSLEQETDKLMVSMMNNPKETDTYVN